MTVIFTGINFLAVLLFVPETRYNRIHNPPSTASSLPQSSSDLEDSIPVVEKPPEFRATEVSLPRSPDTDFTPLATEQLAKKTYLQELSLWSGVQKGTNIVKVFIRPLPLIVYPAILYSFLGYATALAWVRVSALLFCSDDAANIDSEVVAINVLNSFVLQAPPYNWGPAINGLINIPGLLGNIFGSFIGGWCVDRWSDWRARKNHGIFEPETRLALLIFPAALVPAGCILFGYGVERTLNWSGLFIGYGMVAVGLTAVPTITMTYVSDCYLPVDADALLLVNGLKNIVAFGFLYGLVPWVMEVGYVNTFGTQAGIFVVFSMLAIPLAWFGARIRRSTGMWKIIL